MHWNPTVSASTRTQFTGEKNKTNKQQQSTKPKSQKHKNKNHRNKLCSKAVPTKKSAFNFVLLLFFFTPKSDGLILFWSVSQYCSSVRNWRGRWDMRLNPNTLCEVNEITAEVGCGKPSSVNQQTTTALSTVLVFPSLWTMADTYASLKTLNIWKQANARLTIFMMYYAKFNIKPFHTYNWSFWTSYNII